MEQIGYSLIDANGNELQAHGETKGQLRSPPEMIVLPNGDQVHCAQVGDQLGDWGFVERWLDDSPPSQNHESIGQTIAFDGTKIVVTVQYQAIAPEIIKTRLIAYARNKRWSKETGGIQVNGITIATDDRSKQMVLGARMAASADPNFTTDWDTGAESVTLTAAQLIDISNAVLAHLNNCFTQFHAIRATIESGAAATYEAVDSAFV